ncbi:MAG: rhomboid family intramembrane serine protease [Candidatus Nanoarchaeia archaeon]|nr:rhomboid family intramembrane serine protease [Candidatus Nanoarchaeia archaeon]
MEEFYNDEDLKQFYSKKAQRKPLLVIGEFTKFLLISCAVCFAASLIFGNSLFDLVLYNSLNILKYPWILVTNVFFHANFEHLFFNCWAIFMFGSFLELRKGTKFMMTLFFSSVIISNVVFGFFNPGIYGLGISGFVYAIIGSVVVFEPNTKLFIFPLPVPLKISIVGPIFLAIELVLAIIGGDGIGHIAHAAGFIVGFAISKYYKIKEIHYYR